MKPKDLKLPCPACFEQISSPAGEKNSFTLYRCSACKTVFVDHSELETSTEVEELYRHYYDSAQFRLSPATERSLRKLLLGFEPVRNTGRFLDIGFGEGGLLSLAQESGWNCYGTELSPQALQFGTEKGWVVASDPVSDVRFESGTFDVVTMLEFIEHVSNPTEFLKLAHSLLRPGGVLYLTTPNASSINRRVLGNKWSVVCPPEHITIWSPGGMKFALKKSGFNLDSLLTEGFNPVEILALFKNKEEASSSRNEAAFTLNEAFSSSAWRQSIKSTINQWLSLFKLGDGIKVRASKRT